MTRWGRRWHHRRMGMRCWGARACPGLTYIDNPAFGVELLYSTPSSSNKGVGGSRWVPSYIPNRLRQVNRIVYVSTTLSQ